MALCRTALALTAFAVTVSLWPLAGVAQGYSFEMPKAAPTPAPQTQPDDGDRQPHTQPLDNLLENLFQRAQPHLEALARDMQGTVQDLAPAFKELSGLIDDIGNYHMPERLPNGDIIIRRRADAPPPPPLKELPNLLPQQQPALPPGHPPVPMVDPTQPQLDL